MPVPKRKRSHARKHKRNANKQFALKAFTSCANCKEVIAPHQVCPKCGYYRGRKVLVTKAERAVTRGTARKAKAERQKSRQMPAEGEQATE